MSRLNEGDGAEGRRTPDKHILVVFPLFNNKADLRMIKDTHRNVAAPIFTCSLTLSGLGFLSPVKKKILKFNPGLMSVRVTFYESANSHLGSNPVGAITDDITADRGTFGPVEFHFQIRPDWSIIKYVLLFFCLSFPCSCSVSALCPPQQKANALKGWFLSP